MVRSFSRLILFGIVLAGLIPVQASGEGSRSIYSPTTSANFRAALEWRIATYGPNNLLVRRTLLKVFAVRDEYILVASSGVAAGGLPNLGDILIYRPGRVQGPIGAEIIPAAADFSCVAQRKTIGNSSRGRIATRTQELAGPNTDDNQLPNGYQPCFYRAPETGIYDVAIIGPDGPNGDTDPATSGRVDPLAADFGPLQHASVIAWDVAVRSSMTNLATKPGRLFFYYFAGNVGGNGRTSAGVGYIVTKSGFRYQAQYDADPFGFVVYANTRGFRDSDGEPLYSDVMADPSLSEQSQNELRQLQGNVQIDRPEHPQFFTAPDPVVLDALGIPLVPIRPAISGLTFDGSEGMGKTRPGLGGTFRFTGNQEGIFTIVLSRDGLDFDPKNQQNRVLRGTVTPGGQGAAVWDGNDSAGGPFPLGGPYIARLVLQSGEIHFPFLDVENNPNGGPAITLINPPGGVCPPYIGGCSGAFYDDRGYRTADGTLVGTAVNGPLCPNNAGVPPQPLFSDPLNGFDSRTFQRRFGFASGGNPIQICRADSGFGDKKGLDIWTFYPSNELRTPLVIVQEPTAVTLTALSAAREQGRVAVRWATAAESRTRGFVVLRSASGLLADAQPVSALIPSRGPTGGSYAWDDLVPSTAPSVRYWLRELEEGGALNTYGPIAISGAASTGERVWLPLVSR